MKYFQRICLFVLLLAGPLARAEHAHEMLSYREILAEPLEERDHEKIGFYFTLTSFLNEVNVSQVLPVASRRAIVEAWLPEILSYHQAEMNEMLVPLLAEIYLSSSSSTRSTPSDFQDTLVLCPSLDYAEALYKRYPEHLLFVNQYAWMLIQYAPSEENYQKAISMLHARQVLTPSALDTLGLAYYLSGDAIAATQCLLDAAANLAHNKQQQSSGFVPIVTHLGDALYALGRKPEALRAWTTALNVLKFCSTTEKMDVETTAALCEIDVKQLIRKTLALRKFLKEKQTQATPSLQVE